MLNGHEIATAMRDRSDKGLLVVPPPEPEALQGASLDLRLGRWFLAFRQTRIASVQLAKLPKEKTTASTSRSDGSSLVVAPSGTEEELDLGIVTEAKRARQSFVPFGKGFVLHPGAFVLGAALEWMRLPRGLSAYVTGKSSLGRHGLVIETAAGIHPGFSGCLTLEIANVGEVPLEIFPGMVICQVFFHETEAGKEPEEDAGGKFGGSRKPLLRTPAYDKVFDDLVNGET